MDIFPERTNDENKVLSKFISRKNRLQDSQQWCPISFCFSLIFKKQKENVTLLLALLNWRILKQLPTVTHNSAPFLITDRNYYRWKIKSVRRSQLFKVCKAYVFSCILGNCIFKKRWMFKWELCLWPLVSFRRKLILWTKTTLDFN